MLLERRREPGQDGPTEAGLGHGGGGFTLGGTSRVTVSPVREGRERGRPGPARRRPIRRAYPPPKSPPRKPGAGVFVTVTFTGGTSAGCAVRSKTRSFGWPRPGAGSGVSGLPLLRSRDSRLSVSNQNGAPSAIAMIVSVQPTTACSPSRQDRKLTCRGSSAAFGHPIG